MIRIIIQNLHAWDERFCDHIFSWNGKKNIDRIMYILSKFGDGPVYPLIGILILLINYDLGKRFILAGLIAFSLELPGQIILKKSIKRRRPCIKFHNINNLISLPDEFSFPSGHTAAAFCMATLLTAFFPAGVISYYLLALLIGLSRIYNGVHYPGDVIGGAIIGLLSAKMGLMIVN